MFSSAPSREHEDGWLWSRKEAHKINQHLKPTDEVAQTDQGYSILRSIKAHYVPLIDFATRLLYFTRFGVTGGLLQQPTGNSSVSIECNAFGLVSYSRLRSARV